LIPIIYNSVNGSAFQNDITGGFGVSLAKTSVANFNSDTDKVSQMDRDTSLKNKLANIIPDIIVSLLFLGFYIYW